MAEIVGAAASVISVVLSLSKDLYKEVKLREGVKGDIQKLKDDLRYMEAAVKGVDELEMSDEFREWVSDVRRLAYAAENIIDTFSLTSGPETRAGSSCIPCFTVCRSTRTLRSQLKNLMEEAKNIESRRAQYANVATSSDSRKKSLENMKKQRVESSYAHRTDEHMVGLEDTIDSLAGKLKSGGSDHHFVMSILGMGGLGKTTLARRLYNKLSGTGHFQARAWICVSQEYDPEDLLLQLITMIINPIPKKEELENLIKTHSMEKYLYDYLKGFCFLVVIDDVWDIDAWTRIHGAFPQNNINSRIIITTRNKDVAQIDGAYVHEPRGLNEEESWELFCRKSFPPRGNVMTKCPAYLVPVGKEMVKKCNGLPLALVTLGGLLSRKSPAISEWESVNDNLWDELKNGEGEPSSIDAVLTLSYKDLHYNLKRCFLYIGMFPEDSRIPISKLMLLWEAEGFNREEGGRLEDTSKYFKELVDRSLLQEEVGHSWITGEYCRIHDLLRELVIKKAKDIDSSAFYYARQRCSLLNEARPLIRLAISYPDPSTIPHDYTNDRLRTFRLMTEGYKVGQSSVSSYISVDELVQSIHGRFSMLRVLDIEVHISVTNLQLGDMIHLRYLGIDCSYGGSVELPENIGNLKALQTISIITFKLTLPETMGKLQNLKHMTGSIFMNWVGNLTWIGKLTSLETLFIQGKKWGEIDDTTSLINLHRLTIGGKCVTSIGDSDIEPSKFYSNLASLTSLHTLDLEYLRYRSISYFEVFNHCRSIRHFRGIIHSESRDFHLVASNLEVLEVEVCDGFILPSIQELPKLWALKIYIPSLIHVTSRPMLVMDCSKDGFAQLQTLHIHFHPLANNNNPAMELKVADGGLPLLTNFHVNFPERLIAPDRLKQIITAAP